MILIVTITDTLFSKLKVYVSALKSTKAIILLCTNPLKRQHKENFFCFSRLFVNHTITTCYFISGNMIQMYLTIFITSNPERI